MQITHARRVSIEIERMESDGQTVTYVFELAPADRSDFLLQTEVGQLRLGLDLAMDIEAFQLGDFMSTRAAGGATIQLRAHGKITKQERRQFDAQ